MSELAELRNLPYRRWFPWLELFRAGGLAVGWPQLGISFVAVAVFWSGAALMDRWYVGDTPNPPHPLLPMISLSDNLTTVSDTGLYATQLGLCPWNTIYAPWSRLVWYQYGGFKTGPYHHSLGHDLMSLCWAIAVWSLFGTAICRAISVEIAKDHRESLPHAIRFAWPRWLGTIGAPSIPVGGILALSFGLIMFGWFGYLPLVGDPLLTILSPLILLAGLAIACLALVILWGWPLMVAAMGTEDCDGFGALSRSYSFLTGRPAYAVWNAAISAAYGGVLVAFVGSVLSFGLMALPASVLVTWEAPEQWSRSNSWPYFFAQWLLLTFAVSLFWSLATLNYLLLRQAVDGKPFDDIAPGVDESTGRRDLPVVGIPAADLTPDQRARLLSNSEAELAAPVS